MSAVPAVLVGNVVADSELRHTDGGVPYVRFRVATNERYRDNAGEWKDLAPVFWNCEAWKEAAETIHRDAKRGRPVIVTGTVRTQSWTTEEGEKRSRLYVRVEAFGINALLARARSAEGGPDAPAAESVTEPPTASDEGAQPALDESWEAQS